MSLKELFWVLENFCEFKGYGGDPSSNLGGGRMIKCSLLGDSDEESENLSAGAFG